MSWRYLVLIVVFLFLPPSLEPQTWQPWEQVSDPDNLHGAPSAASWGPNRLDAFAMNYDGRLWHRWWEGQNSGQELLGPSSGKLQHGPVAVSWGVNRLDMFADKALDMTRSQLWNQKWDGSGNWPEEPLGSHAQATLCLCSPKTLSDPSKAPPRPM